MVFRRWNWKFHTSFASLFSSAVLLFHRYSCRLVSWPANFCCFAQATAKIISAQWRLVRYSLFTSLVHPATSWSLVSEFWVHILQLLWSCQHHLLQHHPNHCRFTKFEILGQPNVTFLLLPSIQFTLLMFHSILPYPLVLYSLFQLLLHSLPRWFLSSIDHFLIFLNVVFLKLDLLDPNEVHCPHCFSTIKFSSLVFSVLLLSYNPSMLDCFPGIFSWSQFTFYYLVQLLQFSTSKFKSVHWIGC